MRLGISTLLIAALASMGLAACGDETTGGGGAGGGSGGSDTGTGGDTASGTGGEDTGSGTGGGGGATASCTIEVVADADAECDADCDAAFSNADETFNLCTTLCDSDAECDTANTDLICDGALGACVYSCGDGAPGCPSGYICDDAETGAGTLLCIPDELG